MEALLDEVLPRILSNVTFMIHPHQGKTDLVEKLPGRLRGYAKWLPQNMRIIVLVDRDDDDCHVLKQNMERYAAAAGLTTRSSSAGEPWHVVSRIAIEELEAWYFGEWNAVRAAYPRAARTIPTHSKYRNCDEIVGGTWEALERILKRAGYFSGGLRKVELARSVGKRFNAVDCSSPSFNKFYRAVLEATA